MDDLPESDRLYDFPHPREQADLVGHAAAEGRLLQAYLGGKFHHAWIFGGPKGIGKATLAYRLARFVLRHGDPNRENLTGTDSLHVSVEDPVFKRVASRGHADVFVANRIYDQKSKRLRAEISAETVRKTTRFYTRTAGEGGWRICIVDAADDMNNTAANALLKILEEPPERALFILIAHAPKRLLPTIRSRCIGLSLNTLARPDAMKVIENQLQRVNVPLPDDIDDLVALSGGSPGRALSLLHGKGWKNFTDFKNLMAGMPKLDQQSCVAFAERISARGGEDEYAQFLELLTDWLAAGIRRSATGQTAGADEKGLMRRDRLGAWSKAWEEITHSIGRANALNLDRKQTVLQTLYTLEEAAAGR